MVEFLAKIMLDASLITSMLILAYLSRKMGNALKIRPYYVILFVAAMVIAAASGIDAGMRAVTIMASPLISLVTLVMRVCAGVAALCVCLRYWSWLFSEFFGR
jgi:hypothetical protein